MTQTLDVVNAGDYKFVLEAARLRFPDDRVWISPIHAGNGLGLFLQRKGVTVCLQLKNEITVGGKPINYDIRDHGNDIDTALDTGFANIDLSLKKDHSDPESKELLVKADGYISMRDDEIMRRDEANTRRVLMLLKQFEFLNTRQIAYEEILSTPWARIKALFNPEWLKAAVDNKQKELLAECERRFTEAAAARPIIKPVTIVNGNGN